MTSQQILHADALDILFENRNKAYGAYALRKHYPQEMAKALGTAVVFALLLLLFAKSSGQPESVADDAGGIEIRDYVLPDTQKPEPPQQKPAASQPAQVKQQEFVDFKVVDKPDIAPVATQEMLEVAAVSGETFDGPEIRNDGPIPPASNETGVGSIPANEPEPKPEAPLISRSPEFPGGMKAWTAFLSRHLQSPQDLEEGEKKTVVVRFNVAEDGTVTAFQVVQSAGGEFDNEVIRVLKKMPKWMPALQQGQPIAVSFAQQVSFVGGLE